MQRFQPPVLVDEIQYAPELLPFIEVAVDRIRTPGQFWLTGSQEFHLMQGMSETMAGRVGTEQVYGLVWRGDFPAIALDDQMDWELFYGYYLQTYPQRDVRDLACAGDERFFLRFVRSAASRTGQLSNLSDLPRDTDISNPPLRRNYCLHAT